MFFYRHFMRTADAEPRSPAALELEDIQRNIGWLLSSVRSVTSFLPTLGISDAMHHPSANVLDQLRAEVLENLRRYEPRLEVSAVVEDWDDDADRPFLTIDARVRSSAERFRLAVDVTHNELSVRGALDPRGDGDA